LFLPRNVNGRGNRPRATSHFTSLISKPANHAALRSGISCTGLLLARRAQRSARGSDRPESAAPVATGGVPWLQPYRSLMNMAGL
jgi:hypothetical protein